MVQDCIDTGGNDAYAHFPVHVIIKGRSHDNVCIRVDFFADAVGRLIKFEQGDIASACNVDQDALGTTKRNLIQ